MNANKYISIFVLRTGMPTTFETTVVGSPVRNTKFSILYKIQGYRAIYYLFYNIGSKFSPSWEMSIVRWRSFAFMYYQRFPKFDSIEITGIECVVLSFRSKNFISTKWRTSKGS